MNAHDHQLQALCPTVMVPKFEPLPDLDHAGHRFLAGRDGLWIEARRAWLHARIPLTPAPIPLPYGELPPLVDFRFGRGLLPLLRRFVREAAEFSPDEHAAWLGWNQHTQSLEYLAVRVIQQSGSHIRYERPLTSPGVDLCVDLHSHGRLPAFFSSQDDRDDDETKLAICVGNCDQPFPSLAARLCLQGAHIDLSEWLNQMFAFESRPCIF